MSRKFFPIFEHHQEPLVAKKVFIERMMKCCWLAGLMCVGTILVGGAAYHYTEGQSWVDAFLNAVMIMTGLGLVDTLHTTGAKLFSIFYSIISAVVFYGVLAVIFSPLIHRFLHEFHLEVSREKDKD